MAPETRTKEYDSCGRVRRKTIVYITRIRVTLSSRVDVVTCPRNEPEREFGKNPRGRRIAFPGLLARGLSAKCPFHRENETRVDAKDTRSDIVTGCSKCVHGGTRKS